MRFGARICMCWGTYSVHVHLSVCVSLFSRVGRGFDSYYFRPILFLLFLFFYFHLFSVSIGQLNTREKRGKKNVSFKAIKHQTITVPRYQAQVSLACGWTLQGRKASMGLAQSGIPYAYAPCCLYQRDEWLKWYTRQNIDWTKNVA